MPPGNEKCPPCPQTLEFVLHCSLWFLAVCPNQRCKAVECRLVSFSVRQFLKILPWRFTAQRHSTKSQAWHPTSSCRDKWPPLLALSNATGIVRSVLMVEADSLHGIFHKNSHMIGNMLPARRPTQSAQHFGPSLILWFRRPFECRSPANCVG